MVQDIRQCIILLKNFEKDVEELIEKCNEVRKQHIEDAQKIRTLEEKVEELELKLKEYEQGETDTNSK